MERQGIPTVSLVHDRFDSAATAQARAMGLPDLPRAVVPQVVDNRGTPEQVKEWVEKLYPYVVQSLTQAKPVQEQTPGMPPGGS